MDFEGLNISVVIPCYKVEAHIRDVVRNLPSFISRIILVNDCSPDGTAESLRCLQSEDERVVLVEHKENQGVGAAMLSGFEKALELNCDFVVKMDGDDQMDPQYLPDLVRPLINDGYHFSKGNRFGEIETLKRMPVVRRIGNLGLSFLIKAASGYWSLFDPTNGFFCISRTVLERLAMHRLAKGYFFESSLLIELYYTGAGICDVPIPSRYGKEESNLSVWKTIVSFPPRLLKALVRRIVLRYFIYEFSIFSIYLLVGLPLFLFGLVFGAVKWIQYASINVAAPTGTVMVATLAVVLGFQLILAVIQYDLTSGSPFRSSLRRRGRE